MATRSSKKVRSELDKPDHVFDKAAELFRVMSAPMRLKIISCLCEGEQNVSYLLSKIDTTQPNMSQHLNTLYKAGVLAKERNGVQIYYRIANEQVGRMDVPILDTIQFDSKELMMCSTSAPYSYRKADTDGHFALTCEAGPVEGFATR